jgi:hypothetical protein
MTNPIPQDPTVFGAPGHWASGDDLGGAAALRAEEARQDWIFTFGGGHWHPLTGESLVNRYVVIAGTCDSSRELMVRIFGQAWSNQYASAEDAGVGRFGLRPVDLPPVPRFPAAAPEHTGVSDVQADLLAEIINLRYDMKCILGRTVREPLLVRLDRIEALLRGEQR